MKRSLKTGLSAIAIVAVVVSPAFAGGGAFDFLDPCIKARDDFAGERQAVRVRIDRAETSIPAMTATPEFREAWMKAKRVDSRPYFDQTIAPALRKYGVTDFNAAFEAWFEDMIASVDPQDLKELIDRNYRELAKYEIAGIRAKTEAEYDSTKKDLDAACKKDVGSQVLRVALAPLGWIDGNFKAAKNEDNVVTQVFRAVTGVSAKDIAKFGPLGGPNSELRKLANTIAGGENSEVRKTLRFFDPSNFPKAVRLSANKAAGLIGPAGPPALIPPAIRG
jgi:hypothetical protein